MQIQPYLNFNGNCEEAFKFFEKCFGGKIEAMISHANAPTEMNVSPEWRNKIMHARLKVGDALVMGSDASPQFYKPAQGFHVSLQIDKAADADRIFQELSENGSITMPIQQTFWAARFGMVTDRFGIPWMVNCEKA
jgi:PhnB protein